MDGLIILNPHRPGLLTPQKGVVMLFIGAEGGEIETYGEEGIIGERAADSQSVTVNGMSALGRIANI